MESLVNKAALGELTLGEVWEAVKDRVEVVRIEDPAGEVVATTFHLTPGLRLGFSNSSDPESVPEYSFDLKAKVKVREGHIEIPHEDWFGEEETLSVQFLLQPPPEVIRLDFLLPGGAK